MIKIDGNQIIADENNVYGLKLPAWLKTGQTLEKGNNVFSISVIEFTVNGTALDYSQNLSVTTPAVTVPAGKVWKIESILKDALVLPPATATYATAGTYTYTPSCSGVYSVKVWGGGGGGGANSCCVAATGGGGGGGGYAEGSFLLSAGTNYVVTVGTAGVKGFGSTGTAGGTSSVGTISISATGGGGGQGSNTGTNLGGAGGVGTGGQINGTGTTGTTNGPGGSAYNGGVGGSSGNPAGAGISPGGGGGGGTWCGCSSGGNGAAGQVIISIAGSASGGSSGGSRDRLQVTGSVNVGVTTACQYVVPSGKIFRLDAVTTTANGNSLYMGSSCSSTDRGQITIYNPTSGSTVISWPYPQWYGSGTYFYYTSGTAYIQGLEFEIEQ